MKSSLQTNFVYLLIFIAILAMVFLNFDQTTAQSVISINQLASKIQAGEVQKIIEDEDSLTIITKDEQELTSTKESGSTLVEQLIQYGVTTEELQTSNVTIEIKQPGAWVSVLSIISYLLPFLIIGASFFFIFRQAQGSNNSAMAFGKSRARMFTGDKPKVTFQDVAGVDEAKEELQEVVEFLREPQKFITLGARIPKGVLLVGPPGGGKTLLAKAVSGEAGVPFFSISGSEFVEMFVGVGASRVRDLFEQAKKHSPCIVFIDEIDAVGRHRGAGLGGSHDEREQTLNQMLVEMDGFDTDTNVIIMAATNRPDILDPALMRPGRFDRRVVLDRPDVRGREAILKVHVRGKPIAKEIDLAILAKSTPGFVGADIESLVNEAAILAARNNKKIIEQSDFEEAIERVIAGPQRKSRLIGENEKRIIAYHEAGHAIVISALPEADQVQKISIISRGLTAGYTIALPDDDHMLTSKKKLIADMTGLLGGRAAEEIIFNDITSGAANDIENVTKLARKMVTRLGMSKDLGPMVYGQKDELVFLGREISEQRDYSDAVAEKIDAEVQKLVDSAYQEAKKILLKYKTKLDQVATKLLEAETLTRDEFEAIFSPPVEKNSGGIPQPNHT
ncbi:MAG: ATP-dependent metallopeptidase FtsH/Yme1/Tma family protein [Anaerolineaceae bacterium]|nr:MAG: ATP-dependent metallopeptidase FtsH/Yme1/Tma family protein [Anaerolineaceae bacterium]